MNDMIKVKLESSLESAIITLLATDYATMAGNKPRRMLARDVVEIVSDHFENSDRLDIGQVRWMGVDVNDRPSYGKNARNTAMVPLILTLVSREDIDMRQDGYSSREIRERRIVRLFQESYQQGGLLSNVDVATLLDVSPSTVSKQAREFMERENVVLPTRGTIHDLGMSTTHKRIILLHYLAGHLTPEIARLTDHSEEAVDRYIRAFEKVRLLRDKDPDYISRATGMSRWLVAAYLAILQEYEENNAGGEDE